MRNRAEICVHGDVLDGRFRLHVQKLAERRGLVGYAELLPDLSIHIVCEGEEEDMESLVAEIQLQKDPVRVEKTETRFRAPTGEFGVFEVRARNLALEIFAGNAALEKLLGANERDTQESGDSRR